MSGGGCSHCGAQGKLKKCARCTQAAYCGSECQAAHWKVHKPGCKPSVEVILRRVTEATEKKDCEGVLKWEGRMEELLSNQPDEARERILRFFSDANAWHVKYDGSVVHALRAVSHDKRRVELLTKLERWQESGETMHTVALNLLAASRRHDTEAASDLMLEALQYCQRAMEVGNVHGISSLQCSGSSTAGKVMMEIGMGDVGVPCLRRALHLSEDRESELINLQCLTKALIETNALEEAAELLVRFRAAGKAESQRGGNISIWELDSLQASALLHEARGKPSEAADDVRALLLCVHEIEARHLPGVTPRLLHNLLSDAASSLKVLDLDSGDRQLAQSVAARLARLASQMRQ